MPDRRLGRQPSAARTRPRGTGPAGAATRVEVPASDHAPPLRGLPPVIAPHSRLLILGSFPGEASLAAGHYYAHPRNLFWPILGEVLGKPLDEWPFERRYEAVLAAGLAIWDVWGACRREGSLDSAIREGAANDFVRLHRVAPRLRAVLFNGQAAGRFEPPFRDAGYQTRVMPSTSPAYASMPRERKLASWREAIESLR